MTSLVSIIDSVAYAWSDRGMTLFRASCEVIAVARQLGYPKPLETGMWAGDIPALLVIVARRVRYPLPGEIKFPS